MIKQLNIAIIDRLRIKSSFLNWFSRKEIGEEGRKAIFHSKVMTSNQQFWNPAKPFFSNESLHSDDHISINDTDETVELVELFNTYFINVVENTTGQATTSLGDS